MSDFTPVIIPRENLNDETVTLVAWLVDNGSRVDEGQPLAEVESSKAVFEIPAPVAGIVQYDLREGEDVEVGSVLCVIYAGGEATDAPVTMSDGAANIPEEEGTLPTIHPAVVLPHSEGNEVSPEEEVSSETTPKKGLCREDRQRQQPRFSQKAIALLMERGLGPEMFADRSLVRTRDILETLGEEDRHSSTLRQPSSEGSRVGRMFPAPVPAIGVPVRTEKLPRSKRTEVRYLASSYYNTLASVVTVAVPTRGLRAAVEHDTQGVASTATIIVFEVARLLRKYPHFNAYYTDGEINFYEEINVGFAVDAGNGLKVPVIRNADTKGIQEIVSEMQEMLVDYSNHRLSVDSLAGGTFTVTDLSGEDVFAFHPLINQGQSAILGIGGEFFPTGGREGLFNLILAFDHQLSEGRQAAKFLNELGERLRAYEKAVRDRTDTDDDFEVLCCARCLTPLSNLHHRGRYLVQTVQLNGDSGYICSICLQGW